MMVALDRSDSLTGGASAAAGGPQQRIGGNQAEKLRLGLSPVFRWGFACFLRPPRRLPVVFCCSGSVGSEGSEGEVGLEVGSGLGVGFCSMVGSVSAGARVGGHAGTG